MWTNGSLFDGPVSVCINDTYFSVCYDQWDVIDAGVVCRQLGYNFSSKKKHLLLEQCISYFIHILKVQGSQKRDISRS